MAQQAAPSTGLTPVPDHDFMPLNGIDHVELYVGNALQAAYYYAHAFGFREVAYPAWRPARATSVSHVLQQGRIRLVLTGALHSDSPIAAHQHKHGDGVKVIALRVPDVDHAYREATSRGAEGVAEPHEVSDEHGTVAARDDRDLRRDAAHVRRARRLRRARSSPASSAVEDGTEDSGMLLGHRPHRRQRRARHMDDVGQVLRGRLRDDAR